MIFHNQYTLTIGQYEIMEITGNKNIICRLPFKLPKKWVDKAYKKLMTDYNKSANQDKIDELIERDSEKLDIGDRAVFLDALENMIRIAGILGEVSNELTEIYKKYYGKEPETKADFEKPFKEKKLLLRRAEQEYGSETEKPPIDVKVLIRNIESILKTKIRNDKFYLLAGYIDDAAKLNKPKE